MSGFEAASDPARKYKPVGRCIYCDNLGNEPLGDEHIIPLSLNGTLVLPQASCRKCEKITSYLDGFIARSVFHQVRVAAGLKSRRALPKTFPVILKFNGQPDQRVEVSADIHPATLVLPKFKLPDLLSGKMPDGNFEFTYRQWMRASAEFDAFVQSKGAISAEVECSIKPQQFSRVLAKIAHSFAVAELGIYGFRPALLDLIHRRNVEVGPQLVGSEDAIPAPESKILHEIAIVPDQRFVLVRIRLFASSSSDDGAGTPVYLVVAGARICWLSELSRRFSRVVALVGAAIKTLVRRLRPSAT